MLIASPQSENYLVTDMMKKAINSSNLAQDMIQGSTQNAKNQYWVMRTAVVQMAEEADEKLNCPLWRPKRSKSVQ